jgi:hypothetical protein
MVVGGLGALLFYKRVVAPRIWAAANLYKEAVALYNQATALVNLVILLQPRRPLPKLGGFALSADLAFYLVDHIRRYRPRMVVELGSGASTVILALALERFSPGARFVSVEDEPAYAPDTEGLSVSLRPAPLTDWYDRRALDDLHDIDLLFIDGPKTRNGQLVRYPALPFFYERLSDHASVVLDDAKRAEERETIRRWAEEFPDFSVTVLDVEKGAAVFTLDRGGRG